MKTIISIFYKELLELSRDKKALMFILLLPAVAIPVVMSIVIKTVEKSEKESRGRTLIYAAQGFEYSDGLAEFLEKENMKLNEEIGEGADLKEMVREGSIDFALRMENEDGRALANVLYRDASASSKAFSRAQRAIHKYNKREMKRGLSEGGYSDLAVDNLMESVIVKKVGVSTVQERIGETVGRMVPYVFIILSFVGAAFIATDIGAGDKERGSLEATLLAPIPRYQIVLGKFSAVFATGMTTATITILSASGWLYWGSDIIPEKIVSGVIEAYTVWDVFSVYMMLIPMVAIFAAMLLAASVYAKNYKEAQSLVAPMQMLAIVPAIFATLPGMELEGKWLYIPVTNVSLSIRELLKGTLSSSEFWIVFGSTSLAAMCFVVFCSLWFKREEVVFRS